MTRVKVELPDQFPFSTNLTVRIDDINYGGHLSNDAVLSLMHEARLRFLQHYGFSELDVGGASLIMADTAIEFKSESFQGDVLNVEIGIGEFTNYGFDLFYKLTHQKNEKVVARAKTGMVCFDYEKRQLAPVPEVFQKKMTG